MRGFKLRRKTRVSQRGCSRPHRLRRLAAPRAEAAPVRAWQIHAFYAVVFVELRKAKYASITMARLPDALSTRCSALVQKNSPAIGKGVKLLRLTTQTQGLDEFTVAGDVLVTQVAKQVTTLADLLHQTNI